MSYEPLQERWRSFGWGTRVIDGHDIEAIIKASEEFPFEKGKPSVVIADTVKSKGISFAEDRTDFHYWKAKDEEIRQAEQDFAQIDRRLEE